MKLFRREIIFGLCMVLATVGLVKLKAAVTPGTITQVNHTVVAAAGNISCVITPIFPTAPPFTQFLVVCTDANILMLHSIVIPRGGAAVFLDAHGTAGDGVTIYFQQNLPTSAIWWNIAANGVYKNGIF